MRKVGPLGARSPRPRVARPHARAGYDFRALGVHLFLYWYYAPHEPRCGRRLYLETLLMRSHASRGDTRPHDE